MVLENIFFFLDLFFSPDNSFVYKKSWVKTIIKIFLLISRPTLAKLNHENGSNKILKIRAKIAKVTQFSMGVQKRDK